MFRKMALAAFVMAAVGLLLPDGALARGGYGGAHAHPRWGWHHHGPFWPGAAVGIGWPYYAGYDPFYVVPYTYEDYGGCHVARQRVMTRSGWLFRAVDVCE